MKKLKKILFPLLIGVVLIGIGIGYYFYSAGANYYSTDNAKVTAQMYTITPSSSGKLLEWDVKAGDLVEKDQILGRTETLPYITSPSDGMVIKTDMTVNQAVTPATQLAVIADTSKMYIGINVEETDIYKIKVGQKADVTIDAYAGKIFSGKITEITSTTQTFFSNPTSFSTSGTYTKVTQLIPVKVEIENGDNLPMTFGMNAAVKIHLK
ncbi:MAG: putative multidrug resistance protein EmrK [Candidatus Dichloromethanomonas elyunquensis]|nr:MAG: putative multidrug resistance protein EmrK [Candidatus Dichloromethanomonas elyunquensis]